MKVRRRDTRLASSNWTGCGNGLALRDDIINALRPSFPLENDVRLLRRGSDPISVHSTDQAIETLLGVIDASIAAQPPQQTANTRKAGRDRFWDEMVAIWIGIGGAETGIAAAEFLVAASNPVFDRVWNIGGRKTAISAPYDDDTLAPVVEWLRLRAKARRRHPKTSVFQTLRLRRYAAKKMHKEEVA